MLVEPDRDERPLLWPRPSWHAHAACHGLTDLMFPERGAPLGPARAVCATCPVQAPCLAAALHPEIPGVSRERHGVWAGTSERERRTRLAERKDAA